MKNIITISREFGSGGRTIAKEAAQRLGYAFYDKDLIEKIAEESGLSREYIEAHGEHAPGKCRSIRGNNRIRKCTQPMIQQQVSMTG